MKITFIGLSSFLIENQKGFRILVDPFNPSPDWTLGPDFPKEFQSKPFGANIVLMSEPDADHAYAPGEWLQNAPATKPNSEPFPGLDLRGTVVYEWNGDLNVAWHYSIDGLRLAHFGDCSHVLTATQLKEIGNPDIVFMAPPKADGAKYPDSLQVIRQNIALTRPKLIIWAHHLAPTGLPSIDDKEALRSFFRDYFRKNASTNKGYKGEESFQEICYCLENAFELGKEFDMRQVEDPSIVIDESIVEPGRKHPVAILFTKMLSKAPSERA